MIQRFNSILLHKSFPVEDGIDTAREHGSVYRASVNTARADGRVHGVHWHILTTREHGPYGTAFLPPRPMGHGCSVYTTRVHGP